MENKGRLQPIPGIPYKAKAVPLKYREMHGTSCPQIILFSNQFCIIFAKNIVIWNNIYLRI